MEALSQVDGWPCPNAAVAVVTPAGLAAARGDLGRPFAWASVTKLATAVCVLRAAEDGLISLADAAGPPGSTVRHLLAHASGLPFEGSIPIARPAARRIYSNAGFELLGSLLAEATGVPFADYFAAVWGFPLAGSPASGVVGSLASLLEVARELLAPTRLTPQALAAAAAVQFAGLGGVLPGFGRYEPNDFGLGFELRDAKSPHWTGAANSPATFGHFGRAGGFLWVDPAAGAALACLTDHDFGEWARAAWPALSNAVLSALPRAAEGGITL